MIDNGLDEWLLYMLRVFNRNFFSSFFRMQGDGIVSKYGETNHSLISDNFNAVFACRVVCYKTPGATAY